VAGPQAPISGTVTGTLAQPVQLSWTAPAGTAGVTKIRVGGYPGYSGIITAVQRITAS